ncbi:MAG: hypothetical protein F9K40_17320 [Kofleriaceae bacterium]|nr:MAG: hypothetical protein F9K40_17320 [Kofleriaceae bacterium]MBZ0238710.1 hypothetical protein [Kofleriaceae bacterium]
MARPCMRAFLLVLLPFTAALLLSGCASGFEGNGDDDPPRVDARATIDAPFSSVDGSLIDAPVSTMVDAPVGFPDASIGLDGGTGGACTTHAECGSGMCCFGGLMCIAGDPLPLPPPFDCVPL